MGEGELNGSQYLQLYPCQRLTSVEAVTGALLGGSHDPAERSRRCSGVSSRRHFLPPARQALWPWKRQLGSQWRILRAESSLWRPFLFSRGVPQTSFPQCAGTFVTGFCCHCIALLHEASSLNDYAAYAARLISFCAPFLS